MTESSVRVVLALGVVGGFLLCILAIVAVMVTGFLDSRDGLTMLKDFAAVFTGLIGLIFGYYFGKQAEKAAPKK